MAAATLSGSSVPLDGGGFVVTVICPNTYSHQRLMQALQNIVPDAGEHVPPKPTAEQKAALEELAAEARRMGLYDDVPPDDDEGERDFTACRVEGGCE